MRARKSHRIELICAPWALPGEISGFEICIADASAVDIYVVDLICREGSGCATDPLCGGMEIGEPALRIAHNCPCIIAGRSPCARGRI